MKHINQDEPVLVDALSAISNQEARLLTKFWKEGERLWRGNLPRHTFQFVHENSIRAFVFNYFQYECYKEPASVIADDDISITNFWLEILPKILWLSEEWIEKGGFEEPWMAHWNPRIGRNVVHPGQTRSTVLEMFGHGIHEIPCVYFNTGAGYDPAMMHSLEAIGIDDLINDGWNVMTFVPDHEALIPHFSKSIEVNSEYKKEYHERIVDRLTILGIETNTDSPHFVKHLQPWVNRRRKNVEIIFEDEMPNYTDCSAALVCALLGKEFTCHRFKVRIS